jgi:pyruvate/2-oxoglutarate dehydrogenase complex dihydrolipoamide acyltransferase (E2) component
MNKQNHANFKLVQFPKIRRAYIDVLREGQRKHIIHALLEVDVTDARRYLREHKVKTGEALSFTAFIVTCLAKAVDENKFMQAYRQGRNQLILFEDVDVNTQIEREMDGHKVVMPCIIRAANTKTFREIHQEIRQAQALEQNLARKFKNLQRFAFLLVALPAFVRGFYWRAVRKHPRLFKQGGGTVAMTSVGMFGTGVGWGIPIAGHTLMLTLCGIAEKPAVVDAQIAIREYLSLTISLDHDIIDGAPAARFAQRLKELIESGFGLLDEATSALHESKQEPLAQTAPK